jgi:hypothetical protein
MAEKPKARVVVKADGVVTAHVPAETLYNLEALQQIQANILGKTGCPTCCSGRQIIFQQEEAEFSV